MLTLTREAWGDHSLLASLDKNTREDFLSAGKLVTLDEGENPFEDRSDFLLLLSACTKTSLGHDASGHRLVSIVMSGDMAVPPGMHGVPDSLVTTCCDRRPGMALAIPAAELADLLTRHPVAEKIFRRRIRKTGQSAEGATSCSPGSPARVRLARALTALADAYGTPFSPSWTLIGVRIARTELASAINRPPTATMAAMQEMRRSGLMTSQNRQLLIDVKQIRAMGFATV